MINGRFYSRDHIPVNHKLRAIGCYAYMILWIIIIGVILYLWLS